MVRRPGRAGAAILWLALWPAAALAQSGAPAPVDQPAPQPPATVQIPTSPPAQPSAQPSAQPPVDAPVAAPVPPAGQAPIQPAAIPPAPPSGENPAGTPTAPSGEGAAQPPAAPAEAQAQPSTTPAVIPSAILTVDQDALYSGSAWGRRARAELDARRLNLQAENDRIAAELEAEDDALTALRPTLAADEFRRRADAFDARVQQVRAEREELGRALVASAEADRTAFLNAALPVFSEVMQERGASVILDRRTVFLSQDSIDATAELIARIDAALGEGATPEVTAPEATEGPATGAPGPEAPASAAEHPVP